MIKNPPNEYRPQEVYINVSNVSSVADLIDVIPEGIDLNKVYISAEKQYLDPYDSVESAVLVVYYKDLIKNPNYEAELNVYNMEKAKNDYYQEHMDDHFKVDELLYLLPGQVLFLDNIELAPLKHASWVQIDKVLPPISPNNMHQTKNNWCQNVYFTIGGKNFNTILYSKDVVLRKDWS